MVMRSVEKRLLHMQKTQQVSWNTHFHLSNDLQQ